MWKNKGGGGGGGGSIFKGLGENINGGIQIGLPKVLQSFAVQNLL